MGEYCVSDISDCLYAYSASYFRSTRGIYAWIVASGSSEFAIHRIFAREALYVTCSIVIGRGTLFFRIFGSFGSGRAEMMCEREDLLLGGRGKSSSPLHGGMYESLILREVCEDLDGLVLVCSDRVSAGGGSGNSIPMPSTLSCFLRRRTNSCFASLDLLDCS